MQRILDKTISEKRDYITCEKPLDEESLSKILMGEEVQHIQPNSGTVRGFRTGTDGMKKIESINVIVNVNDKIGINLYVKMLVPIYTVSHESYSFLRNVYKADHVYINTNGKNILIKIIIDVHVDKRILDLWEIKNSFKPVVFNNSVDAKVYANGLDVMGYLPSITTVSCGCALLGDTYSGDTIVQATLDGLYGITTKDLYKHIMENCDTALKQDMVRFVSTDIKEMQS